MSDKQSLEDELKELQSYRDTSWNTSESLKSEVPGIEKSRGWLNFKDEFDRIENQIHRIREDARVHQWMISPPLWSLKRLATEATGRQFLPYEDPLDSLATAKAGKNLGETVLRLFSAEGRDELAECLDELSLEYKKKSPGCTDLKSNVSDLMWAFRRFISREKRLPSKKGAEHRSEPDSTRLETFRYPMG